MKTSTGFEKSLLPATRVVGLVAALAGILGIVIAAAMFAGAWKPGGRVTYDEVAVAALAEAEVSEGVSLAARELPPRVAEYLGDEENLKVVSGWLSNLPTRAERADFLNNLERIVKEAEKRGDDVIDVINAYSTVKLAKMESKPFDQYESAVRSIGAVLMLAISFVMLIGGAIPLVLLAIERNTRRQE